MSVEQDFQKYIIDESGGDDIIASSITTNELTLTDSITESSITLNSAQNTFDISTNASFKPIHEKIIMAGECITINNCSLYVNSNRMPTLKFPNSGISNGLASLIIPKYVKTGSTLIGAIYYKSETHVPGTSFSVSVYVFTYDISGNLVNTYSSIDFALPSRASWGRQYLVSIFPIIEAPDTLFNFEFIRNSSGSNDTNGNDLYVSCFVAEMEQIRLI